MGSLVVREPDEDNPVSSLYDTDLPSHVMVIQDWMHAYSNEVLPGLLQRILGQGPDSYLINGWGVHVVGWNFSSQSSILRLGLKVCC